MSVNELNRGTAWGALRDGRNCCEERRLIHLDSRCSLSYINGLSCASACDGNKKSQLQRYRISTELDMRFLPGRIGNVTGINITP